jgi:hypothetical protein
MFPLCSLFSEMAHELRPHVANHLFANFGGLSCAKHLVANFGGLSVSSPVTSEAGAICHSKITTKLEKGNLYFSVTREKGKGEGGRRKHHFREIRQLSAISANDSYPNYY